MIDNFIVPLGRKLRNKIAEFEEMTREARCKRRVKRYLNSERRPWSPGYSDYRLQYLKNVVYDFSILETFREARPLPEGYGHRLDARMVEVPWMISNLKEEPGVLLDAGSSLNYEFVLKALIDRKKDVSILTLAPENNCFWKMGVSYLFGDLRNTLFRDKAFDTITCISTIEHVGMDNTRYASQSEGARRGNSRDFMLAVKELNRILKPGGDLYITFPFGRHEDHGWFQQFDAQLMDVLISCFSPTYVKETIFQYNPDGWALSTRDACADCKFFDVHTSKYFDPASTIEYPADYPAGERAVACLILRK